VPRRWRRFKIVALPAVRRASWDGRSPFGTLTTQALLSRRPRPGAGSLLVAFHYSRRAGRPNRGSPTPVRGLVLLISEVQIGPADQPTRPAGPHQAARPNGGPSRRRGHAVPVVAPSSRDLSPTSSAPRLAAPISGESLFLPSSRSVWTVQIRSGLKETSTAPVPCPIEEWP